MHTIYTISLFQNEDIFILLDEITHVSIRTQLLSSECLTAKRVTWVPSLVKSKFLFSYIYQIKQEL